MGFFNNRDKYSVAYNQVSCNRYGLYLVERPDIPTAEDIINEYEVLGRDGKIYCYTGFVKDKEITIKIGFFGDKNEWSDKYRAVKSWLKTPQSELLPFNTLQFSDDTQYYYKVKKIVLETTQREACDIGKVDVVLTLDGYNYTRQGLEIQDFPVGETLNNDMQEWSPTITVIRGDGIPDSDIYVKFSNGEYVDNVFTEKKALLCRIGLNETIFLDMNSLNVTCLNTLTGVKTEAFNRLEGDITTLTTQGALKWEPTVEATEISAQIQPLYKER